MGIVISIKCEFNIDSKKGFNYIFFQIKTYHGFRKLFYIVPVVASW